jgi:hypothetical protein
MRCESSVGTAAILTAACFCVRAAVAQDTLVVRADNPPAWGEDVQLVEEIRIGVLEGQDEYLLGSVGSLAVGHDGMIFVYDGHVPVIRQYDPSGTYVKDVGREGAGPGEYRRVLGMRVLANGQLAIWDPRNVRIAVYDSAGRYVEDHHVPSGLYGANVFFVDTAGNFYVRTIDASRRGGQVARRFDPAGPIVVSGPLAYTLVRVSPSGQIVDSVPLPIEEPARAFVLATAEGYRGPFVEELCYTWSPQGYLIVGHNSRYTFDLQLPDSSVRRIERSYEPVRASRDERSQWEAWAEFFARRPSAEKFGPIPREKPAYRALSVDEDGRIWVNRYSQAVKHDVAPRAAGDERPLYAWREPPTFDVITPEGDFLGTVVLPANTSLHVRRGMQVWGVQRGEFDEEYVVRYRIEPSRD